MSGSIVALDHVQVAAPPGCEDDARRFYGELLGLEEVEKPSALAARGGVWFRVGPQELHVGVTDAFAPATKAHPALRATSVAELGRLVGRLEAAGVDVHPGGPGEIPGITRFFVGDPWGNRVELLAS